MPTAYLILEEWEEIIDLKKVKKMNIGIYSDKLLSVTNLNLSHRQTILYKVTGNTFDSARNFILSNITLKNIQ